MKEGQEQVVQTTGDQKQRLFSRIASREARIGVIGLGYVGLPLVVEFGNSGFETTGFDVDPRKVEAIHRGESYIPDVPSAQVAALVASGKLNATTDFQHLSGQEVIVICVPTPLRKTKDPDVSYIMAAAERIQEALRPGCLVVLESTTYPGTTDEVLRPMFDQTGLRLDEDYFLAFSPERVDPGNPSFQTRNIPKVVGGVTADSTEIASALYGTIVEQVHSTTSARVAETCKLLENTFRAVNIGMVNELAQLCHALKIDTWEVIAAASTKPFGFMPFYPGPGIGGHCIPLDPHYLSWKARMHGFEARFISLAEEVNSRMPEHVVHLTTLALNRHQKAVNGSKILILGVAYKRDIDDMRESPALSIIEGLGSLGATVTYHDPFVPTLDLEGGGHSLVSVPLDDAVLTAADCVVIVTDHRGVDYRRVAQLAPLIVDTRNVTRQLDVAGLEAKVVRL